jgi:hypothetical protein
MLSKLAALSDKNNTAAAPKSTNKPTHKSLRERCIANPFIHRQIENIKAVSTKSSPSTAKDAITTVRVVARDTPSGVG